MYLRLALSIPLALAVMSTPAVHAAIGLRFEPESTNVVPGGEVTIGLILVDGDGDVDSEGGLFAGGGQVLVSDSSTATASIADASSVVANEEFSFGATIYPFEATFPDAPPPGFTQLAGLLGVGDFSESIPTSDGEILLAEFTISVHGEVAATLELEPSTLGESFAANVGFNTGVDFDAAVVNTFGTTITVVPEPTAFGTILVVVLATVVARRPRTTTARHIPSVTIRNS